MKNLRKLLIIFLLLILYCYFINVVNFPNVIITYNEKIGNYRLCPFLKLKGETQTSSEGITSNYNLSLSLGDINLKTVELTVMEETEVVPVGRMAGLKLYIDGVMIVGFSKIENISGNLESIADTSNLYEGERIVEVNGIKIDTIQDLKQAINESYGENLNIIVEDAFGVMRTEIVTPIQTGTDEYKIGLWVKEGATGVGTISYYNPKTNEFVALGHGIVDSDTGEIISIDYGEITSTNIISITKGVTGNPGEVKGVIKDDEIIGKITKNTPFGLFGTIDNLKLLKIDKNNTVPVALRNEIKEGKASLLCSIDGKTVKEYSIEIQKIFINNNEDNKSFVIKVTDEELIEETGGIIRGLSGSPIMQDGKMIGAVTNVLVANPTVGYGIFADLLLSEQE